MLGQWAADSNFSIRVAESIAIGEMRFGVHTDYSPCIRNELPLLICVQVEEIANIDKATDILFFRVRGNRERFIFLPSLKRWEVFWLWRKLLVRIKCL
jgi:hypothetical protein